MIKELYNPFYLDDERIDDDKLDIAYDYLFYNICSNSNDIDKFEKESIKIIRPSKEKVKEIYSLYPIYKSNQKQCLLDVISELYCVSEDTIFNIWYHKSYRKITKNMKLL